MNKMKCIYSVESSRLSDTKESEIRNWYLTNSSSVSLSAIIKNLYKHWESSVADIWNSSLNLEDFDLKEHTAVDNHTTTLTSSSNAHLQHIFWTWRSRFHQARRNRLWKCPSSRFRKSCRSRESRHRWRCQLNFWPLSLLPQEGTSL